jgi:hypothetical protein
MSLGVLMLVHTAFERAEAVARYWSASGCPVVIHVDRNVPSDRFAAFSTALADDPNILFCRRHRCDWGTWGLVAATQSAAALMLSRFPAVAHVCLTSGACLPIRPVEDLLAHLAARPETDFIESATTSDVTWTVGGLHEERFTMRFPFAWKRQRRLFDRAVLLQRRLGLTRSIPAGLNPHIGSQWWCLTRTTLAGILGDPDRPRFDRYFRRVWIPDESYFQTLARRHSRHIDSRSLTLSAFDFQGKPHVFYDDHLDLLAQSDQFIARKIWPRADWLYDAFLSGARPVLTEAPARDVRRVFAAAVERRTLGRPGLVMQSRCPNPGWENGVTAAPFTVFHGFDDLFPGFVDWASAQSPSCVHGHLFDPRGAMFADGAEMIGGGLSRDWRLRDYAPNAFLRNLIWAHRGRRQAFLHGPADRQAVTWVLSRDANARIGVVTGAWIVPLARSTLPFAERRARAARLQKVEREMLAHYGARDAAASVTVWSLADAAADPSVPLRWAIRSIGSHAQVGQIGAAANLPDLDAAARLLRALRDDGLPIDLAGTLTIDPAEVRPDTQIPAQGLQRDRSHLAVVR